MILTAPRLIGAPNVTRLLQSSRQYSGLCGHRFATSLQPSCSAISFTVLYLRPSERLHKIATTRRKTPGLDTGTIDQEIFENEPALSTIKRGAAAATDNWRFASSESASTRTTLHPAPHVGQTNCLSSLDGGRPMTNEITGISEGLLPTPLR